MSCAHDTPSVAFPLPAPAAVVRIKPPFTAAMLAVVEAFREALELRRAAHRSHPLDDE